MTFGQTIFIRQVLFLRKPPISETKWPRGKDEIKAKKIRDLFIKIIKN